MSAAARAAIAASIRQDRIVWLGWSSVLEDALTAEADDGAENGDVLEFWGESEAGYWRVHLDRDAARACVRFEKARRGD